MEAASKHQSRRRAVENGPANAARVASTIAVAAVGDPTYPWPVIVVIGRPLLEPALEGRQATAAGLSVGIARAAAAGGAAVQLAGNVGADADGDVLLGDLARAGIGHVAVLRDPARPTPHPAAPAAPVDDGLAVERSPGAVLHDELEASWPATAFGDGSAIDPLDVDLALRYLSSFSVLVVGDRLGAEALAVAAEAADYAGAQLIVVVPPDGLPATADRPAALATATLFEAPEDDPDGEFAALVGRYAAALDRGDPPGDAFRSALGAGSWEPAAALD